MSTKTVAAEIDRELYDAVESLAKTAGRSVTDVVSDALAEYLRRARQRPEFRAAMDEELNTNAEVYRRLAQ